MGFLFPSISGELWSLDWPTDALTCHVLSRPIAFRQHLATLLSSQAFLWLQVFVTCGTVAKRAFLLEAFPQLDDAHIGDSRSCSFEALIKRQTNGAGVHLALNSLADDKLQVCAKGYTGLVLGLSVTYLHFHIPICLVRLHPSHWPVLIATYVTSNERHIMPSSWLLLGLHSLLFRDLVLEPFSGTQCFRFQD